jgi:hypothetical protein
MVTYQDWQRILIDRFFGPGRSMRRVHLNIDLVDFPLNGHSLNSLIAAVHDEVEAHKCSSILELLEKKADRYRLRLERWRNFDGDRIGPPDVLPSLMLLILAVHHGGDQFGPNDYYGRLRDLLSYSVDVDIDSIPMRNANKAWRVLEVWSCQVELGRSGLFEVRVLGSKQYIGIPLRQTLLSPSDEEALRRQFEETGLEPGHQLSSTGAMRIARTAGLRARARTLLADYPTTSASRELIDEILDLFAEWQPSETRTAGMAKTRIPIRLRFSARDTSLQDVITTVRIPKGLHPETGVMDLSGIDSAAPLRFEEGEYHEGAGEILAKDGSSLADHLDWFAESHATWNVEGSRKVECFRRCAKVLWFERPGPTQWVECFVDELEPNKRYLEVRIGDLDLPERPGAGSGEFLQQSWVPIPDYPGLHVRIFVLQPDVSVDLVRVAPLLRGGIRTNSNGVEYLDFALPTLFWPNLSSEVSEVVVDFLDNRGSLVSSSKVELKIAREEFEAFGHSGVDSCAGFAFDLQPIYDGLSTNKSVPVLAEAYLANDRNRTKARVFIQITADCSSLNPPPKRNRHGFPDPDGQLVGRVGLLCNKVVIDIGNQPPGRPFSHEASPPPTNSAHLRLCRLLRSRGEIPWSMGRSLMQQCGRDGTFDDRRNLTNQVLALHQLGVLELIESGDGGFDRIQTLAPRISITSTRINLGMRQHGGFYLGRRFSITGAWLARELQALYKKSKRVGGLICQFGTAEAEQTLLPGIRDIVTITDAAIDNLQLIAKEIGAQFECQVPDALSSLACMDDLDQIISGLEWHAGVPGAGYDTSEFDPIGLCRRRVLSTLPKLGLLECKRHDSGLWVYFIVDRSRNCFAKIHDRQLGRWIVRSLSCPDAPVPVDQADLVVPLELRLPRHIGRVFALESGRSPETVWYRQERGSYRSPFCTPELSSRFRIPRPPHGRIRPYESADRCSGVYLRYPMIYGTAIWKIGECLPVIGAKAERIATIGLD